MNPMNPMNNAELSVKNAMPMKDINTDNSSRFSMGRILYSRSYDINEEKQIKWYGNSKDRERTASNRIVSRRLDFPNNIFNASSKPTAYTTNNSINVQRESLQRTRNGGSTVPRKSTKYDKVF